MEKGECKLDGCSKLVRTRGLCAWHYELLQRTGATKRKSETERFWLRVDKTDSCWLWTGSLTAGGYGRLQVARHGKSVSIYAHRLSFEMVNGPVPSGMVIDHICHRTACVNPNHLRATTHKQNTENRAGAPRNNKVGIRGVRWSHQNKGWTAAVGHNGKRYHVGTFSTIQEAEAAAIAKRNELFTHNDLDRIAS